MSALDSHEADELPEHIEGWAEDFRSEMPAELRRVVLENLPDLLDGLAPGKDRGDDGQEAWRLALAEFRADLTGNPNAFDVAEPAPVDQLAEAERLLRQATGYPPNAPELLGVVGLAQAHATIAVARIMDAPRLRWPN